MELGVEVEALHFVTPFCRCTPRGWGCSAAHRAAEDAGIPVRTIACGEEYLEVVKHPRYGRGSRMNACLDCRLFMFRRARGLLAELGADFIATGEVLGQRPMSQRRDTMQLIEREAGLEGMVLRPLSAGLLAPSIPEQRGWIDRRRLLALHGRSRRPQMAMAADRDIRDYPCPAGGCLLNDPEYAARFKDLLDHRPDFGLPEARLLNWGRHFRLPSGAKVIVARDEAEGHALEAAAQAGHVLLAPEGVPGPTALCPEAASEPDIAIAAGLVAAHTKGGAAIAVRVRPKRAGQTSDVPAPAGQVHDGQEDGHVMTAAPVQGSELDAWRVAAAKNRPANVPQHRTAVGRNGTAAGSPPSERDNGGASI
jgi:hypothetical protein